MYIRAIHTLAHFIWWLSWIIYSKRYASGACDHVISCSFTLHPFCGAAALIRTQMPALWMSCLFVIDYFKFIIGEIGTDYYRNVKEKRAYRLKYNDNSKKKKKKKERKKKEKKKNKEKKKKKKKKKMKKKEKKKKEKKNNNKKKKEKNKNKEKLNEFSFYCHLGVRNKQKGWGARLQAWLCKQDCISFHHCIVRVSWDALMELQPLLFRKLLAFSKCAYPFIQPDIWKSYRIST